MSKKLLFCLFYFISISTLVAQKSYDVYFDFASDYPNKTAENSLYIWIARNPKAEITKISGFCDSVDVSNFNKELSLKRIHTVLNILKGNSIKIQENLTVVANGKDFDQSKKMAENRKVVFEYQTISIDKKPQLVPKGLDPFGRKIKEEIKKIPIAAYFENIKKGEYVKLNNINFYLNSDEVIPESYTIINELYEVLLKNPTMKIEIQGHICCNILENGMELSKFRASFIVDYLVSLGIDESRLTFMGFGNSKPIYTIPEKNEQERIENRRVEILITDL